MTEMLRKEVAAAARTIVVKVGTRVVTGDSGYLDDGRIARLAEQLNELRIDPRWQQLALEYARRQLETNTPSRGNPTESA